MRALFVIAATLALGCSKPDSTLRRVCLEMPTAADNAEAMRGIDWWGSRVEYSCDPPAIRVHAGPPPFQVDSALGYTDRTTEIVWVRGPVFWVVRHEWGHVLGYDDSASGVMASGAVAEPLAP